MHACPGPRLPTAPRARAVHRFARRTPRSRNVAPPDDSHAFHVKFSNVLFDTDSYRLYLSIHVVNPQSGEEPATIPVQAYRGGRFTVYNCLQGALEKVADKVRLEVLKVTRK